MYWPKESDPSVYPGPAGEIVTPEETSPRLGQASVAYRVLSRLIVE